MTAHRQEPRPEPHGWATGCYWGLVGAGAAFGLVGIMTIGIFVLAGTAVLLALGIGLKLGTRTLPAMIIGAAVAPGYIAFLNRGGPGRVCTTEPDYVECADLLNPWIPLAIAAVMVVIGVVVLAMTGKR